MPISAAISRAGKTKRQTPHVPKQHDRHKKDSLRTKCDLRGVNNDNDNDNDDDDKRLNQPSLTAHDLERQLYMRDKRWMLTQKRMRIPDKVPPRYEHEEAVQEAEISLGRVLLSRVCGTGTVTVTVTGGAV